MMKKLIYSIVILMMLSIISTSCLNIVKAEVLEPQVIYTTHVQEIGWQEEKTNGQMSGTQGESLRLEAIKIELEKANYTGDIEYSTHVQEIGWQDFVKNNQISGTAGLNYRLEAIKIRLTGEIAEIYDIYYRVHAEQFGWLDWAKNGQAAGTQGYSYRLEGIEIKLVKKGNKAPGQTQEPYKNKQETITNPSTDKPNTGNNTSTDKGIHINYSTHVEQIGWQNEVKDGKMAGTSGKSLRLEAIKINLSENPNNTSITYRTHVQNEGWQQWKKDNEISGTSGKGLRLEAIEIKPVGQLIRKI